MRHPPAHARGKQSLPLYKTTPWWGLFLIDLMVIVGSLFVLFVIWQLWWTTFKVEDGMKEQVLSFQSDHPAAPGYIEIQKTTPPPIMDTPEIGQLMGVLHVPKWNQMAIPVQQGTESWILDTGNAGHYVETQLPGEIGNSAFAGHRRTYGNNFRQVHIMEVDDPIVFETDQAWLVYKVIGHEIVSPTQGEVLLPVPNEPDIEPTKRILTMTTCDPEFGNTERFILYSELAYWVPKDAGTPKVLEQ